MRGLIVFLCAIGALILIASHAKAETCIASWYGNESGPRTANGERFRIDGMTCAHKTRPFGQIVPVTRLDNGRSISCRINDRGPFIKGRCIDLSRGAARALGMGGLAKVRGEE